jgi:HSP20 family protein
MADALQRRPRSLSRALDWPFRRLFEDFVQGLEPGLPELWSEGRFVPAVDVSEDADGVTLTAEIPGMSREDIEVTVDNGVLTLAGEKRTEETREETGYHRTERRYGRFERRIRMPQYVDVDSIDATYKDGVLTLRMPRAEAAKARSVQIKEG